MLRWLSNLYGKAELDFHRFQNYWLAWGCEASFLIVVAPFTAVASGVNWAPEWRQSDSAFWALSAAMLFFAIVGTSIAWFAPNNDLRSDPVSRASRLKLVVFHTVFSLVGYFLFFFFGGKAV